MPQIPETFKTAFINTVYDLILENQKKDPQYRQAKEKYAALFNEIRDLLGRDDRKLMLRLEEMQNEMEGMDDEMIYLQGMIDCAALLRAIRLL